MTDNSGSSHYLCLCLHTRITFLHWSIPRCLLYFITSRYFTFLLICWFTFFTIWYFPHCLSFLVLIISTTMSCLINIVFSLFYFLECCKLLIIQEFIISNKENQTKYKAFTFVCTWISEESVKHSFFIPNKMNY